jgi:hypothetical protein
MKTLYQVVGVDGIKGDELMNREQLLARFTLASNQSLGHHLRPELQGEPVIENMCGPSWGGFVDADGEDVADDDTTAVTKVVRYDTWAMHDLLSR